MSTVGAGRPGRAARRPRPGRAARTATLAVLLLAAGCAGDPAPGAAPAPAGGAPTAPAADPHAFGHVHGVGLNPADGLVYAATHHGVFRLEPTGPERVADRYADVMGFTVAGPDEFLASGHPAPTDPGPPHLGLIRSTDRAETWETVSLAGEADFHALAAAGSTVAGWDSQSGQVRVSRDGGRTWTAGAALGVRDLAVDPADPDRLLATTAGGLGESRDGGATFAAAEPQPPTPLLLVDLLADGSAAGVDPAGGVWARAAGPAGAWERVGALPGPPEAFSAAGDGALLAAAGGRVHRSDDGGSTWEPVPGT